MLNLKHLKKILVKILSSSYSYGKLNLLFSYVKLLTKSIAYHKLGDKKSVSSVKHAKLLGLTIHFFEYHQIIDLFEEIFIFQVYRFNSIKPSPLIFDCGSNIGIAVLYFKKLFPQCRIVAFEPDEETFLLLKKNIESNGLQNVTLFNIALSDIEGYSHLFKKPTENGSLTMSMIRHAEDTVEQLVPTKKLSFHIEDKIEMMKIDVEGSESNIMEDLILNDKLSLIEKILIEYHPMITSLPITEFMNRLKLHNFSCNEINNNLHEGATEKMIYCRNNMFHA